MLGLFLFVAGIGLEEQRRDRRMQNIADNLQFLADRERKRTEMRRFLAERGLQTDDEVLARMGL